MTAIDVRAASNAKHDVSAVVHHEISVERLPQSHGESRAIVQLLRPLGTTHERVVADVLNDVGVGTRAVQHERELSVALIYGVGGALADGDHEIHPLWRRANARIERGATRQ